MAEAVAEALGRIAHQGVALEYEGPAADPDFPPAEPLSSDARIRVRAFLPIDCDLDEKRMLVERALWPLQMIARNSFLGAFLPDEALAGHLARLDAFLRDN